MPPAAEDIASAKSDSPFLVAVSKCQGSQRREVLAGGQEGGLWVLVLSPVWDGTFSCPSRLWSSVHYPWVQPRSLPLLSHPWVRGRYSTVSQFLGPWNVCFRLLSIWGFMSLKCCNRSCDPIIDSLPSSTPIADSASVRSHWAWWSRTWATSWGSSRSQAASPFGGPSVSRNYGWRGPCALCCLVADVLRG